MGVLEEDEIPNFVTYIETYYKWSHNIPWQFKIFSRKYVGL